MKRPLGTVCAVCLAVTALLATWHAVGAEQVDFRFKWPWRPLETTAVAVTTLPYSGVHDCQSGSCTDAYDFVISDDRVISSAEGTVIQRVDSIDPQTCIAEQGLGNCAKVLVPTPTEVNPASTIQVWYGHLQSVSAPPVNGTILQGDPVGIQGITGYTIGNDYGWNGTSWGYHCGRHLHFEFYPSSPSNPQRPDKIDGQNTKPTISPPLVSTNSGIGQYWYYGTTNWPIRNKYIAKGGWDGLNPSDPADDMGWTSDPQRSGLPSPRRSTSTPTGYGASSRTSGTTRTPGGGRWRACTRRTGAQGQPTWSIRPSGRPGSSGRGWGQHTGALASLAEILVAVPAVPPLSASSINGSTWATSGWTGSTRAFKPSGAPMSLATITL